MIKRRRRKVITAYGHRELEYYLKIKSPDSEGYLYMDWLTCNELAAIEGCVVGSAGLKVRMANKSNNPNFTTLEGCIFSPREVNGNSCRKARETRRDNQITNEDREFNRWCDFHKLMKPLKSKNCKVLIMQSMPIC